MFRLEVMNPVAQLRAEQNLLAEKSRSGIPARLERPATLDGKVIGFLWDGMGKGDETLKLVAEMFKQRFENVETKFYWGSLRCPPALLEQAAKECDVVVAGFAD